jgi:hypothetical protein
MKKILVLLTLLFVAMFLIAGCDQDTAAPAESNHDHDHGDSDDHGHEHGDDPYEWSGVFSFAEGSYVMHFQESGDPSIAVVFLLDEGDRDGSDHMAYHIMEAELEAVPAGGEFEAVSEYGYNLMLNPDETITTFVISEAGDYLLYLEHFPEEFDLVIKDAAGNEMVATD